MTLLFSTLLTPALQSSQDALNEKAGEGNQWITAALVSSVQTITVDSEDHAEQRLARLQLVDLAHSVCACEQGSRSAMV